MSSLTPTLSAAEIAELLRQFRHSSPADAWAFFTEMRTGCGYQNDSQQFIDAWAINCYPSQSWVRIAYEIKVSRADFLAEKRKPLKRRRALALSNQFYFVTPPDLVRVEEVPTDAGLIEVSANQVRTVIVAPHRDSQPPTWNFLAAIARLAIRSEQQAKMLQARLNKAEQKPYGSDAVLNALDRGQADS